MTAPCHLCVSDVTPACAGCAVRGAGLLSRCRRGCSCYRIRSNQQNSRGQHCRSRNRHARPPDGSAARLCIAHRHNAAGVREAAAGPCAGHAGGSAARQPANSSAPTQAQPMGAGEALVRADPALVGADQGESDRSDDEVHQSLTPRTERNKRPSPPKTYPTQRRSPSRVRCLFACVAQVTTGCPAASSSHTRYRIKSPTGSLNPLCSTQA